MTMPQVLGGRYELGEIIGRGGWTEVYRAHDVRLGRAVAVKVLRLDLLHDPGFQRRFREARIATQITSRLVHPSLMAVYDTGEESPAEGVGLPWVVMELVQGRSIRERLANGDEVSPVRALEIVSDVCAALDLCHLNGTVHGDVSAGNVLLTTTGQVKLVPSDFALRRATAVDDDTDSGAVVGTAEYLSPEVCRGEPVDGRSDVYSTGCLLYALLVGQPPFVGDSSVTVAFQHVLETPVAPSELTPRLSAEMDAVVLKALAKAPADRFQTAADMRAALLRIVARPSHGAPAVHEPEGTQPASVELPTHRAPQPQVASSSSSTPPGEVAEAWREMLGIKPRRPLTAAPRPAPPAGARAVTIKDPKVLGTSFRNRREEDHGDEVFTFDNSRSSSTATETIRTAHTARIEVTVDMSKVRSTGGHVGVRFLDVASAEGRIQSEIRARHGLNLKEELVFEQTTSISIPASTHVRVIFHWKRVWEEGTVTVGQRDQALAEVPYAITVKLRFNKETSDVPRWDHR